MRPERHIIKGLLEKCNYYMSQDEIFDLEFCIPIQKIERRKVKNRGPVLHRVMRSKKLYINGSRYLGINYQNEINFPITRMDLLFWINVYQSSTPSKTIVKRVTLSSFRKIYNDRSLFHHFGSDLELI